MKGVTLGINYKTKYDMIVPKGSIGELVAASFDIETGVVVCQLVLPNKETHLFLNTQLKEIKK